MKRVVLYLVFAVFVLSLLGGAALWVLRPTPVNLVYMADSKYVPYVMVSLYSAIKNKKPETVYHVYVIAKDFTKEDIQKLGNMSEPSVVVNIVRAGELNLLSENLGRFSGFKVALQKIFIADYLKELNKALYLDADTLVEKDLSEVYNTVLGSRYAGVVKDGLMYQFPQHVAGLELKEKSFYFNSGVMLLNLAQIRTDGIMRRAVIYFNTHNEVYGDQDVLNVVFAGKVAPLPYRYNCNSTFFEEKDAAFLSRFFAEPVPQTSREVYDNAAILHFAGHKPWTPWFVHSYLKPLWQQYAAETKAKYHIAF